MKALLCALLLLAAAASGALAADPAGPEAGSVVLGAGAVYFVPGDGNGRWGPSVLGSYFFNERVAAEGTLHYVNESYSGVTAHTGAAQASILGLIGRGMFRIEPLAGVGYYGSRVEENSFHRNLGRFAVHAGVGLEAWLGQQKVWSVDASWRHVWLHDLDAGTGPLQREGEQLNIGLNRKFGRVRR